MTSTCWIYSMHADYKIIFKQVTVSYTSKWYCSGKVTPKAFFHVQNLLLCLGRMQKQQM